MMALHSHPPSSSSHYRSTENEDIASPNNVPATQKEFPFNNHNQIFSSSTSSCSITADDLKPIPFSSLNFYLSREIKSSHNDRTLRDLWNGIDEAGGHITGDVHHICSDLVFVLPHFKGTLYETLLAKGCMIAGVECVLDCFKKGSMPGLLRKYPIFNFALEGEMIATTGYNDENVRKEIARKVRTLGGWFTDDLRKQVTILIAHPDALTSPKCVAARRIRGIAIVSLEWLSKTNASGEKQPLENYELSPPIFKDCVITVSGFNFEARSREMIVGLTEKHGGTYQSVLPKIGRVTHLLVDETNGAKYEHADRFRVHFVINSRWFFESIERGKRLPEENYLMPRPSELEAGERETKAQHTGGGDDILAQDSNDVGLRGNVIEEEDDDEEDSLFLAGCVIFLSSQFKKEKLSRAVRMIRAGGGTRLPEYSHQITHFVVPFPSNSSSTCQPPTLSDSDIRTLQKLNKTPYVVGEKWLFSSHTARKQLPPDEYLIPLPFTISAESQSSSNQTGSAFVIPPGITSSAVNNSQAGMSPASALDASEDQRRSTKSQSSNSSEDPEEEKAEEEDEDEELGIVENRSGPQFLAGVHICMFGFDQDEVREVRKVVSKSGGTISDGSYRRKHNYFMAPHGNLEEAKAAQSEISRTNASVPPLVSSYWIERCIAEQRVVDLGRNVLYTPAPHMMPMDFMSGFSICLVDYTGDEEKDVLATIKFSGAKVETRPSSKTSHLICKDTHSEKYRRARKLGILTVSLGWLEECILTGKFQKETPFLIGDRNWEDSNRQELRNYSEGEEGEDDDNHFPLKHQTEDRRRRRKRTGRVEEANGNRTSINSVHKSFYAPESSELNVLYGVTVFITKSVPSSSSNRLQADVRSLGGEYVLTFNSTVTHIVHQGRVENTKEFKAAKANPEIKIVSPLWILECKKAKRWLLEDDFPFKMNPNMNLELLGPPKPSSSAQRSSSGRANYILPSSSQGGSFSKSSQSHSRNAGRIPELSLVNTSALPQDETLSQPSSSQRARIPLADQIRNVEARRGFGVSISSTSLTSSSSHTSSSTFHRTNPSKSLQFQPECNDEVTSPNLLVKSSTTKQPPKKTTDQHLFARFEEEMRIAGAAIATPNQSSIESTLSLSLKSASIEDSDDHLTVADPPKKQRPLQPLSPSPSPPFIHQALEKEEKNKGKEEEDSVLILPMMTEEDESEPGVLDVKEPEKVNLLEASETQKEASALLSEMEQLFETDEKQTVFPHLSALRHSSTSASHDSSSHLRSSDSTGGRHRHISRSELENDESSQRHFGDAGTPKSNRRRINPFGQNEEPSPSQEDGEEEEGGKRKEELLSLDIRIRYTDLGETSPGPDRGGVGKRKTPPMSTTTSVFSSTTPTKLNSNTSKRICIDLSDEEETHNKNTNTRSAPVPPTSPGVFLGRKGGAGTGTGTGIGTGTGARKLNSTTTSTTTSNATTPNTSTRNSPLSVATTIISMTSSSKQQPKVGGNRLNFSIFSLTLSRMHSFPFNTVFTLPKIFAITGLDDPQGYQKDAMIRAINRLGGQAVEIVTADTTHLIAGSVVRSHKTLASIVLGNFILKPDYIWESEKQGRFLVEEPFEWKTDEGAGESPKLLLALERSKKAKLTGDNLVFRGWRVAFLLKEEKQILYRSIMEFGGAIVISTIASSPNLLSELLEAEVTHVFVERLNIQKDHRRMSELSKTGMKVLISTFITEVLILDPRPPLQTFFWDKHFKKGTGTATSASGAGTSTASIRGTGTSTKGSASSAVKVTNGSGARKKW